MFVAVSFDWSMPANSKSMVTMVVIRGDLQSGRLADQLVAGLYQPKISHMIRHKKEKLSVSLMKELRG
eukprot:845545-Pelagomonas_calceolata.AAC.1